MRAVLVVATCAALAYGHSEPSGAHTSKEWLIWAYSSAAPKFMKEDITVVQPEMKDGKMVMTVLKPGTNGWTCVPGYPKGPRDPKNGWKNAHEAMPLCGDAQAFKWANAYFAGKTPKLDRDGWAWMLHGDQGEDNTEHGHIGNLKWAAKHQKDWIESGPHLMVMPKDPNTGLRNDFNEGGPYTMFSGDYRHVMIPAEKYYRYQQQAGKSSAPKEPKGPHTSKEWLIWAYSSAAPPYMAGDVTVVQPGMKDGKTVMNVLKKGTNGWTCVPGYPKGPSNPKDGWKNAHEAMPFCGDGEAFKWANAYFAGKAPKLDRDGWAWMLHGDQGEDNTEAGHIGNLEWKNKNPDHWIESGAHLMLMPKDSKAWSSSDVNVDFNIGSPYTMFADTMYAHVMVPFKDYYHFQDQQKGVTDKGDKDTRLFSITDGLMLGPNASTTTSLVAMLCAAMVLLGVVAAGRALSHRIRQAELSEGTSTDEESPAPE